MGGPIASPTLNPLMTMPRDLPTCCSGTESMTRALQDRRGISRRKRQGIQRLDAQAEGPENGAAQTSGITQSVSLRGRRVCGSRTYCHSRATSIGANPLHSIKRTMAAGAIEGSASCSLIQPGLDVQPAMDTAPPSSGICRFEVFDLEVEWTSQPGSPRGKMRPLLTRYTPQSE